MFLHEPGEENESFTRQDLSSLNVISTQQPAQGSAPSNPPLPQPSPQQAPQSIAAATQNTQISENKDGSASPTDGGGGGPALPATASWGSKSAQGQLSRRTSRTTIDFASSPMPANAVPASQSAAGPRAESGLSNQKAIQESDSTTRATQKAPSPVPPPEAAAAIPSEAPPQPVVSDLDYLLKAITSPHFKFEFSTAAINEEDMKLIRNYPLLFDPNGGAKRRMLKEREAEERQRQAEAQTVIPAASVNEPEDNPESGSLQLGGEPEERQDVRPGQGQQHVIQPPSQQSMNNASHELGSNFSLGDDFSNFNLNGRGLTQHQQQQLLLQQLKSVNPQPSNLLNAFNANPSPQVQPSLGHGQQGGSAPGHARNASRFTFANDTASASASVKPVANAKLMSQQSSMMPQNSGHFNQLSQQQSLGGHLYSSGVQGPPPGLKTTGTPPVSGGGMFGQGHGFATGGLGYGTIVAGRNANEEMMRELLRGRGGNAGGGQVPDAAKREFMFPSFLRQHPPTSSSAPAPGLLSFPYGSQPGAYQDSGPQKQKKKGKKHRHANTSSSGGGGVVDVADPSILQARLHQGGTMSGQGLYAGHGQGGFTSMYNGGFARW